jgi:hypothetical protein
MRFDKEWTCQEPILISSKDPFSLDPAFIPKSNDYYSTVSPLLMEVWLQPADPSIRSQKAQLIKRRWVRSTQRDFSDLRKPTEAHPRRSTEGWRPPIRPSVSISAHKSRH